MNDENMRAFGYLCPECGKPVLGLRTEFALAAADNEIRCACGKSALFTESDGERFHLMVPCGICGEIHSATFSAQKLLQGDGIALACPDSKQFCCYIGSEGKVEQNLRELAVLVCKEKEQGEEAFADDVVMYEILSELKEIAARKDGIRCSCGSRRYAMELRHAVVDIVCKDCGAKLRIPAATDEDLDRLCCQMTLRIQASR